jgi:hypothetical protein
MISSKQLRAAAEVVLKGRVGHAHRLRGAAQRERRHSILEHVLADRHEQLTAAVAVAQAPPIDHFDHT